MLKLALPKGRLQAKTGQLLTPLGISEYFEGSRNYRLTSEKFPGLLAKMFQERDIAVQVAVGNYDLGICGFNWVEELTSKYPSSNIVVIKGLGYGKGKLCVAVPRKAGIRGNADLGMIDRMVAFASENPNLTEGYAVKARLRRFKVFPVWGSAEVYPSFAADAAVFGPSSPETLGKHGLVAIDYISSREAFLIANKRSWESVDLGQILDLICHANQPAEEEPDYSAYFSLAAFETVSSGVPDPDLLSATPGVLRLALPDGHQQKHTAALLDRAGIRVAGYNAPVTGSPVQTNLGGVVVRVIRPQDMPLQVANGNIDLAITGKDWLRDHLCAFPSSPVNELVDLKFGRVRLVAVVANGDGSKATLERWEPKLTGTARAIRVASEYTNIADKFCREKRVGHYKVIPTWGATEAFLPEDADLLIENSETGETLARHNLKVVDTLFESTGCLIGSTGEAESGTKRSQIAAIVEMLARASA